MNNLTQDTPKTPPSYLQATGKIPYSLTNDYLFRALLQKNNRVLKHLICALLHLRPEEVDTVTIENPIVLGEALDNKPLSWMSRCRLITMQSLIWKCKL